MRTVKTWLLVLAMLGTAAVVSTLDVVVPRASACDCVQFTFEEAVEQVDLIAEVTMVEDLGAVGDANRYLFSMQRVWKGEASQFIVVSENNQETSCGGPNVPEIGAEHVIWGFQRDEAGHYSESECLIFSLPRGAEGTHMLDERFGPAVAVGDADPLGPSPQPTEPAAGGDGTSSPDEGAGWWRNIPLVIAAFAALAATAGGFVLAFGRTPRRPTD